MKIISFVFVLLFGQSTIGYSQAPYQIKSCKIDYVFSNGFQKGTKILIFNDSGKLVKQIAMTQVDTSTNTDLPKELIGNRTIYNQLIIQTTDSLLTVDLDNKTGKKRATFFISDKNVKDSMFNNMLKKVGQDTLLGRKCEVFDLHGAKLWYWKGIVVKKELLANEIYGVATSINENYIIKKDEFEIPTNIKLQ